MFTDDTEKFAAMRQKLFTAVVGDVLDQMGLLRQFLPPEIRALRDDMVLLGRAMPVLDCDFLPGQTIAGHSGLADKPFGLMFRALDDLQPNEIYLATGASPEYALWGELMSTRAMHLKATGAVLNGYCRDSAGILKMGFPTFCFGTYAQDQGVRGKVVDFRVSVKVGQAVINPGDILFGDRDGVLVIPRDAEDEAVHRALEKVATENKVRKAIEAGMSTVQAFETFGVM